MMNYQQATSNMIDNRKLGSVEQAMEKLNSHAKTWNIVTISRIKGNLSADIIRKSLDVIQHRHPQLNSRIINLGNTLRFETTDTTKIPLRVVKKADPQQWQEVVDEEMNQAIDSSKCLMRAVLVHIHSDNSINYLITTGHHAVGDGLSSMRLHSEILTYCQQIISGNTIHPITSLPPLPPVEELLPAWAKKFTAKLSSTLLLLKLGLQKIWHRPQTLSFEKYVPIAQRHCYIIHRQLKQELTQNLLHSCREANITVNSAICAAMMLIIANKIKKNNNQNINVNCLTYHDLRRHLQPKISDEHMAVLASSLLNFYTINKNTSFWQLGKKVKENLADSAKHNDIFKTILIAKHLMNFPLNYPKQVAATVSVSNAGVVNLPKYYGELELEEISFLGSHALYAGMFITHVLTFQGKMLFNFVFSEPAISRPTMENLVNEFMSYLFHVSNFNLVPSLTKV
jgi:hypothetical protein